MNIQGQSISQFLNQNVRFVIPVYQRNYEWEEIQCKQLFYDIGNEIDNNNVHFLGSICYLNNNNKYVLIDGQQRITSIHLLCAAIRDVTDKEHFKEQLQSQFLTYKDWKNNGKITTKLRPNDKDYVVYKKIINADGSFSESDFTDDDKKTHIYIL